MIIYPCINVVLMGDDARQLLAFFDESAEDEGVQVKADLDEVDRERLIQPPDWTTEEMRTMEQMNMGQMNMNQLEPNQAEMSQMKMNQTEMNQIELNQTKMNQMEMPRKRTENKGRFWPSPGSA